ncbi:MAG: hypothetical protein EPO20_06160 [Betaproteobacteria bacterium]|nr:MAG: hypothetical protein EPO20_06160 [Betaproteobacteria bacterium]
MDRETLEGRIQLELAQLQARFPQVSACRSTLDEWQEDGNSRYALRLDIRWPQHQTLVSGDAKDNPLGALRAALEAAERQLQQEPGVKRGKP